ncbi:MAG: L-2-amino-thiazoline-4-carboxylic acid hydrolase [Bryobacteraceae bacterium]
MALLRPDQGESPVSLSRRGLFTILPAGAAGCLGCAWAAACSQQSSQLPVAHDWTEKTGMTWEQVFRFAYQKDLIPLLKALSERVGHEEFVRMLKEAGDAVVEKKAAGRPPRMRDLATLAASMKNMPPLMQHAVQAEIVEESPKAFEYQVKKCLWAKTFREENAGDIGYAMICYPDYAVIKSLNPKLKLIRTKTLMQGDDVCRLRYVMEG